MYCSHLLQRVHSPFNLIPESIFWGGGSREMGSSRRLQKENGMLGVEDEGWENAMHV